MYSDGLYIGEYTRYLVVNVEMLIKWLAIVLISWFDRDKRGAACCVMNMGGEPSSSSH